MFCMTCVMSSSDSYFGGVVELVSIRPDRLNGLVVLIPAQLVIQLAAAIVDEAVFSSGLNNTFFLGETKSAYLWLVVYFVNASVRHRPAYKAVKITCHVPSTTVTLFNPAKPMGVGVVSVNARLTHTSPMLIRSWDAFMSPTLPWQCGISGTEEMGRYEGVTRFAI